MVRETVRDSDCNVVRAAANNGKGFCKFAAQEKLTAKNEINYLMGCANYPTNIISYLSMHR